jgi:hypothetical protein
LKTTIPPCTSLHSTHTCILMYSQGRITPTQEYHLLLLCLYVGAAAVKTSTTRRPAFPARPSVISTIPTPGQLLGQNEALTQVLAGPQKEVIAKYFFPSGVISKNQEGQGHSSTQGLHHPIQI